MLEISVDDYLFTLKLANDCFKTQEVCKTAAADGYNFTLNFSYYYSNQKMCQRADSISNLTLESVLHCFMIQETCKQTPLKGTLYLKIKSH